jgi:hypothetical protein
MKKKKKTKQLNKRYSREVWFFGVKRHTTAPKPQSSPKGT